MDGTRVRLRRKRLDSITVIISLMVTAFLLPLLWLLSDRISLLVSLPVSFLAVMLGFGLPWWIGHDIRQKRAEKWKTEEREKWGFHSCDREGPWINYVDYPVVRRTHLADGKFFYSDWLIIHDGVIVVNPGASTVRHENQVVAYDFSRRRTYAWDGCTPKRLFYWIAVVGTPDWWHAARTIQTIDHCGQIEDRQVAWQIAHHASLVHDALCQYLERIPIDKNAVDQLFYDMLVESGLHWSAAKIYHWFVRTFGPDPGRAAAQADTSKYRLIFPVEPGGPF